MFYIDNIDWLEDTLGGKITLHYFQMSIFQRKIPELLPIKLNIKKEETESLKLKSYSFNEILPYQKPNKSQFQQSPGCENFYRSLEICPTSLFDICIAFRSFRQTMRENDTSLQSLPTELNMQCINNSFQREQIQTLPMLSEKEEQLLTSTEKDKSLPTNNSGKITENILPSFYATSSLVRNAGLTRTSI